MGQKKGLIYNAFVLMFLFTIWYLTTSKPGHTPEPIPVPERIESKLDLTPLDLTIVVCSESLLPLPEEILNKLEQVTNTFSRFWDLTLNLKSQSTLYPYKKKHESQSSKRTKSLVFYFNDKSLEFQEDFIISLPYSQISEIPYYLVGYLRNITGLGNSNEVLVNGLSQRERESVNFMVNEWLDFQLYREIVIFNQLLEYNQVKITSEQFEDLRKVRDGVLGNDLDEKFRIWQNIVRLNSHQALAKDSHFQWDFKLGVYAPIFFPVVFPICGAIYSRLFLRIK